MRVARKAYCAEPSDIPWISKDTPLVYEAKERSVFFYAFYPADKLPSTSKTIEFLATGPE